jgi:NAD-dependent dihydropyrimidine dehydrogenase PreA subunit
MKLKWLPVVDATKCTGCRACVDACGPKSLELIGNIAVLVHPDTCGSEEHCIEPCQSDAIRMQWVAMNGDFSRGKWRNIGE